MKKNIFCKVLSSQTLKLTPSTCGIGWITLFYIRRLIISFVFLINLKRLLPRIIDINCIHLSIFISLSLYLSVSIISLMFLRFFPSDTLYYLCVCECFICAVISCGNKKKNKYCFTYRGFFLIKKKIY